MLLQTEVVGLTEKALEYGIGVCSFLALLVIVYFVIKNQNKNNISYQKESKARTDQVIDVSSKASIAITESTHAMQEMRNEIKDGFRVTHDKIDRLERKK